MQHKILVTGPDDLLAACISALELGHSNGPFIYRVQPANERHTANFLQFAAQKLARVSPEKNAESIHQEISSRLHLIGGNTKTSEPYLPHAEKVWHLAPSQHNGTTRSRDCLMSFITKLPTLGVGELNLIIPGYSKLAASDNDCRIFEAAVAEKCKTMDIHFRIFRCSLVVGTSPILRHAHDFLHFLDVLYQLKHEIQDRVPKFFSYEPLRYLASADAEINLIRAEDAAQLMAVTSWRDDTLDRSYDIANSKNVPFIDICESIESVYNLSLQPTEDEQELTAIDRLFQEQTEGFQKHLESTESSAWEAVYQAAGMNRETTVLDARSQIALFEGIYKQQDAARSARSERVAALSRQPRRSIEKNGCPLPYFAAGEKGTPVIILNALGQGLFYWYPLIDVLIQQHRVVVWEPRGTISPPQPFGLKEQVEDLKAILKQEEIDSCHLVGWCTGPKVAVEYYLQFPETVQTLVFLNSQFKCSATARELVTSYERNIEPMFRGLEKNPDLAGSVMSALQLNLSSGKLDPAGQDDSQRLAVEVLSSINQNLKSHVLLPYESEATTRNYARQVVDFWSYDTLAKAFQVQIPVLLITTEHDKIAMPAMSKHAVKSFPKGSLVEVKGASHYCLFDRPEWVAGLMEDFFEHSTVPKG